MGDLVRIAVVTGSRAEYGLLYWVLRDLRDDPEVELQLIVTGMHLAHHFGMTVDRIVEDGFEIAARVEMLVASDSASGVAKSMALGLAGMSDAIERLAPDVLLVLGDRFEILAAVQAALVHGLPVAHIAGGDITEGAFDEGIRHAITKMAHVHFVTNEDSGRRVRQMGEAAEHIHVVGSPGLDHLRRTPLLDRNQLAVALGATLGRRNLLVTFHPATLEGDNGVGQTSALLEALQAFPDAVKWITLPNADPGGVAIGEILRRWSEGRADAHVFASLGQLRYLSLMAHADVVVGNSSSGLYEAPSFRVPTVDIGDRQRGRLAAPSVIRCEPSASAIRAAISRAFTMDCSEVVNPYGDGLTSDRIIRVLKDLPAREILIRKRFRNAEGLDG